MSINFGGGSSRSSGTQTVAFPAPGPQEAALRDLNLQLARIQAGEYLRGLQRQQEFEASPTYGMQQDIEKRATQNILARLSGTAPVLSPEEQKRLDEIYGNTQRRGEQDLNRYSQEIAGARGLSVSDSPIGNEALRQQQEFTSNLGAQKAASAFDLGNAGTAFNQAQQAFANQLRQQAYMNRLAFSSQSPASFGFGQSLFGERLAGASRSFNGSGSTFNYGGGANSQQLGAAGLGASGLGFGR